MQVASVSTNGPTVRNEIDGWSFEDASLLVKRSHSSNPSKNFIGYTPSPKDIPFYTSVLEMLADGWELLGPPEHETWKSDDGERHEQWCWWLQRRLAVSSDRLTLKRAFVVGYALAVHQHAALGTGPTGREADAGFDKWYASLEQS